MAVHVDLSSGELQQQAVADFIGAHVEKRPAQDMLFKVDAATFDAFCATRRGAKVPVSDSELRELNSVLGTTWNAEHFTMRERVTCPSCNKVLTFYDLFKSGEKQHGTALLKLYLEKDFFVHVRAKAALPVKCSSCGSATELALAGYDGPQY